MSNKPTTEQIRISESNTLNEIVSANGAVTATEIFIEGYGKVVASNGSFVGEGGSGAQGATGAQGIVGAQGIEGAQGTTGIQGTTGTGVQGTTGIQGTTGTGVQGATGVQGTTGASGTGGSSGEEPQNAQTAPYWLSTTDLGKHIASNSEVMIPANSNVSFNVGSTFTLYSTANNNLTVKIETDTLRFYVASNVKTGNAYVMPYATAKLLKVANTEWTLSGYGNVLLRAPSGGTVNVANASLTSGGSTIGYGLKSDGTVTARAAGESGDFGLILGTWLVTGNAEDFEARFNNGAAGNWTPDTSAPASSDNAMNTWLRMTEGTWRRFYTPDGITAAIVVEIREFGGDGTILDSATITRVA